MLLKWEIYSWDNLTTENLYKILKLRAEVFVVEQNCAYLDPDDNDRKAKHLLLFTKNKLIGYSRIFIHLSQSNIGRVVVSKTHRKQNIGKKLMEKSISLIPKNHPIHISAQEHLRIFYEKLNFNQSGEGYLEDGIPHIPMLLSPKKPTD